MMLLLRIAFWVLLAMDVAALGLLFVLGLAAAASSHTSWVSVAGVMLLLPGALLLGAAAVFVMATAPWLRVVAFLVVAAPLLLLVGGRGFAEMWLNQYRTADGGVAMFKAGAMREIEAAIARDDAGAVAAAARGANLKQLGRDGSNVLVVALRQMEKTGGSVGVLRALLAAGADPNAGEALPLAIAIYASAKVGVEPVRLLLEAGADPNKQDQFGHAAYFAATGKFVDVSVMRMLLDRGADLRVKSNTGATALTQAMATQNWPVMLLLLQKGAEWRTVRTPMGLDVRSAVEGEARVRPEQVGLAEVLRFFQDAGQ
ncbi:MAG: hypothetical protein JNK87_02675 [Bryobacterales bacterium]|nr:hypothetical protein [Bryobacterales bacterium]